MEASADAPQAARDAVAAARAFAATARATLPADDATKAPMRETYRKAAAKADTAPAEAIALYLEAWSLWRPNGQALVQAGMQSYGLGLTAEAQRLVERGMSELEASEADPVRIETAQDRSTTSNLLRKVLADDASYLDP